MAVDRTQDVFEKKAFGDEDLDSLQIREVEESLSVLDFYQFQIRDSKRHFDFVSGDQLSDDEKTAIEASEGRKPEIVINILRNRIASLSGAQRLQRRELKCIPRKGSTPEDAQVMTKMGKYIGNINNLEESESDVFQNGIISELGGWLSFSLGENDDLRPEIKIGSEIPETMFPDPSSRRNDLSDAKFVYRIKWLRLPEIVALFPDMAKELGDSFNSLQARSKTFDRRDIVDLLDPRLFDESHGRLRIFEKWYIKSVNRFHSIDPDGKPVKLETQSKLQRFVREFIEQTGEQPEIFKRPMREMWVRTFIPTLLPKKILQDEPYDFQITDQFGRPIYPFFPFWTWNINGLKNGAVADLIDPQRFLNKFQRWMIEEFTHSTSSGKWAEEGSLVDEEHWKKEGNHPDFFGFVKQGAAPPSSVPKGQPPTGAIQGAQIMLNLFNETAITAPSFLGKGEGSGQSGVRFEKQLQQASVQLEPVLDAFNAMKLRSEKYKIKMAKEVYNYEKWVSVTEDDEGFTINERQLGMVEGVVDPVTRVLNDLSKIDVDVKLVEGPLTPTQRRQRLFEMFELIQRMPSEFVRWGTVIRLTDDPESKEWAAEIDKFIALQTQGVIAGKTGAQALAPGPGGPTNAAPQPSPNVPGVDQRLAGSSQVGRSVNQ